MLNKLNLPGIIFTSTLLLTLTGCGEKPTLASGSWINHDRRTSGTIVDDQAIVLKTNLAIVKNKTIWRQSHISTLTYNNSLLLVGQTKTNYNKQQIEKMLRPINEIGSIHNQITIGEPISLKVRANDTWLTTQVKAKLISNSEIGINRVKVITENSTVYLMGMLTKAEEDLALDISRRVPGVEKVVAVVERTG